MKWRGRRCSEEGEGRQWRQFPALLGSAGSGCARGAGDFTGQKVRDLFCIG